MSNDRAGRGTIDLDQHVVALAEIVFRRSYGWKEGNESVPDREPVAAHRMEVVERARDFMLEHFRDDLSIRRISKAACVSPYHFIRSFKAATGETPYRYLRRLRLSNARFLLHSTDYSVTRIALESGFTSLSHFSDAFSTEAGVSPTNYRAKR